VILRDRKLSLRADLICRQIWIGSRQVWAVKDPLARSLWYFDPHEYEMLALADGGRSIGELVDECQKRLAPRQVEPESVARFYAQAYQAGVLLAAGAAWNATNKGSAAKKGSDPNSAQHPAGRTGYWGLTPFSRAFSRHHWWHNPLAIRCPGWNPDRFLDWIAPAMRWLLSPVAVGVSLLLVLVALVIAVVHFETLTREIASLSTGLLAGRGWMVLLLVVSATKVIHELAHGIVCKLFGGDVLEMGVIFLVGTPCLYCDVSDAWLMDRREKRILVSAAGMLAELTLAALATFLWLFTSPGLLREVSVQIMIICSISTVLFNGNPLLRYDGYFILSDWIGIPNLASESASRVRNSIRKLIWGVEVEDTAGSSLDRHHSFLWWYGIASGLYRVVLLSVIGAMIYHLAAQHELGIVVAGVIAIAVVVIVCSWARQVLTPPRRAGRKSRKRPAAVVTVAGGVLAVALLIPLPRSVTAPLLIQPAEQQPLVVTHGGRIVAAIPAGALVESGTVVARLDNPELARQCAAAEADCERLQMQLEGLNRTRSSQPNASARIATTQKSLAAALRRLEVLRKDLAALRICAPANGRWYAPRVLPRPVDDTAEANGWWGVPTEYCNRGAWLRPGTLVGTIGHPQAREAILLLDQQQIDLIRADQHVQVRLADQPRGSAHGYVTAVASSPADQVAEEFSFAASTKPDSADDPQRPRYRVRVQLLGSGATIPVRTTGVAKVSVSRASIATRIARFLADQFG